MCGSWTQEQYKQADLVLETLENDKGQTAIIGSGSNGQDVYNVYDGKGRDTENFIYDTEGWHIRHRSREEQLTLAREAMAARGFHAPEPVKQPELRIEVVNLEVRPLEAVLS